MTLEECNNLVESLSSEGLGRIERFKIALDAGILININGTPKINGKLAYKMQSSYGIYPEQLIRMVNGFLNENKL